jgi:hypothetical protein
MMSSDRWKDQTWIFGRASYIWMKLNFRIPPTLLEPSAMGEFSWGNKNPVKKSVLSTHHPVIHSSISIHCAGLGSAGLPWLAKRGCTV